MKGETMFRTLFAILLVLTACGCQSYQQQTQMDIHPDFERLQIKPIRSNDQLASEIITRTLYAELEQHFTMVDTDPDIILSGSAEMRQYYGAIGPSFISYAIITIETRDGHSMTIHSREGWFGNDDPKEFAKKVKNILTKNH